MAWALTLLAVAVCSAAVGATVALVLQAESARRDRNHAKQLGRLHLAVSARLHESQQLLRAERRRSDMLIMRLAREQGRSQEVAQTALEVVTLAQLDALWADSRPVEADTAAGELHESAQQI